MPPLTDTTDKALATLVLLSRRLRESNSDVELRFLLVNETMSLVQYKQAVFWSAENKLEVHSGVSSIDKHSAYAAWLNHWFDQAHNTEALAFATDLSLLRTEEKDWQEWLPSQVANIKVPAVKQFSGGQLLIARADPFTQAELSLLEEWVDIWSYCYQSLYTKNQLKVIRYVTPYISKQILQVAAVLLIISIGFIPVHLSVLAPAELTPLNATVIRSPIDGIVDRMLVQPNQRVDDGDALFEFDRASLENQLAVAQQALLTSQAEYRQQAQRAVYDSDSKAQLAVLRSLIDGKEIEVNYLDELYKRSSVKSPRQGVILLNDETEWIGRPVVTGERILVIADEQQVQIEAWVSPKDYIEFPDNSQLTLYLNADPSVTIKANVTFVSHLAELRPEGLYAHRLRARIQSEKGSFYQIGQRGTARIQGKKVSLVYWAFRRPLAMLRSWVGF